MAQAKLTVSKAQAQALGLLVHKKKPVSNILYEPKSGVNLIETKGTEKIEVRDGADLYNLKRFQVAGYFDVVEGTVLPHTAAFSAISLNGTTLTLTFSDAITSPQLTSTVNGASTDDIILLVNGVKQAATFAAKTNSTTITTTIDVTLEDISVQITQTGASKIKDANRSAVLPATNLFSVASIFQSISMGGLDNKFLSLNFNEAMYTAGVSSTGLGQDTDDIIILVDGVATAITIGAILKGAAATSLTVDLGATPVTSVSVQVTATGAAKLIDTDDTAVAGVLTRTYTMSANKAVTAFTVAGQASTIDEGAHTIAFEIRFGELLTAIEPTITVSSKSTVSPLTGAATDFTNPVTYTVTAENGSTQAYVVTGTVAAGSTDATLSAIDGVPGGLNVNFDPATENYTALLVNGTTEEPVVTATATHAGAHAVITQATNVEAVDALDRTATIVVTAQDGITTKTYTVVFTVNTLLHGNDFLTFNFLDVGNDALSADVTGTVGINGTVALTVPAATVVTALIATFTASPSAVVVIGISAQVSGTTPNDFTNPILYTVTAEDGSAATYLVTVTIAV